MNFVSGDFGPSGSSASVTSPFAPYCLANSISSSVSLRVALGQTGNAQSLDHPATIQRVGKDLERPRARLLAQLHQIGKSKRRSGLSVP